MKGQVEKVISPGKKLDMSERILAASQKIITIVIEDVDARYEALAAIRAAERVVASFPGTEQDPSVTER